MVLAWRRLRIHHRNHWRSLAELSSEITRTLANVIVDAVHAASAILTHVVLAVVNVFRAIDSPEAGGTFASVVREMIDAFSAVRARVKVATTEFNFRLTEVSIETRQAIASVRFDAINACSIVLTLMLVAIVDVDFTARTFVARQAFAAETTFLEDRARSVISARISVASVNHVFTVRTMIAWSASAFVPSVRLYHALGVVLARECETSITFRQNLITDLLVADELVGRRRQNEFVFHSLRLGATSDSRLHVIQFHPLGKPFQ